MQIGNQQMAVFENITDTRRESWSLYFLFIKVTLSSFDEVV